MDSGAQGAWNTPQEGNFFNTTSYYKAENKDIQDFLKYVNGESTDNPFIQKIENKVEEVKLNKEWRQEYMTLLMREEEIRDEIREEGIKALIESLRAFNIPDTSVKEQLMQRYLLTKEEAETYINKIR